MIPGLVPGDYKVKETESPAGYILTSSEFTFTIGANGTVTYGNNNALVTYKKESNQDTFIVGNEPGVALPATGGVGTGVVYGAGAAVILLALLGLVLMNRKRGRGTGI